MGLYVDKVLGVVCLFQGYTHGGTGGSSHRGTVTTALAMTGCVQTKKASMVILWFLLSCILGHTVHCRVDVDLDQTKSMEAGNNYSESSNVDRGYFQYYW